MENKANTILGDLYHHFVNNPNSLPLSIQRTVNTQGVERAVCDYIAGMTDRFAITEHMKLNSKSTYAT